jgi:hypothetical protein
MGRSEGRRAAPARANASVNTWMKRYHSVHRFIAILSQHGTQRLRIMIPDRRPARAEAGVANGHTLAPAARNIAENDPTPVPPDPYVL